MANKPKFGNKIEEKRLACMEYLQKSEVSQQFCDALLKLIENKPNDPMLFLASHFDSCMDKSNRAATSLQLLTHTYTHANVFDANLLKAYDALCMTKPSGSKKIHTNPGLIGSVFEAFLMSIIADPSTDSPKNFLKIIGCKSNQVISFDVFRYGVWACFLYKDFVQECKSLFYIFCNKLCGDSMEKSVYDTIINCFKSAIDIMLENGDKDEAFLRAGFHLRPHNLAVELLNIKDKNTSLSQAAVNQNMFLDEMSYLFAVSLTSLK